MNDFDFERIRQIAEELDPNDVAQTDDYFDEFVIPVGTYTSFQREIAKNAKGDPDIRHKDDGSVVIALSLTGGIQSETGEVFANGTYPLKAYISSKRYSVPGRPGQTSGLAQYLKATGEEVGGKLTRDLLDMIPGSLEVPVGVQIGWSDRSEKLADGTFKNANLKTKDFNQGSKQEPRYVPVVTIDGKTYKASAKVDGWRRVKTTN